MTTFIQSGERLAARRDYLWEVYLAQLDAMVSQPDEPEYPERPLRLVGGTAVEGAGPTPEVQQ